MFWSTKLFEKEIATTKTFRLKIISVHIIQNDLHLGLAEFMHSMENLNGEYFDNATWAMPDQMSQWYEAFVYKWDHKREFTNNIIET